MSITNGTVASVGSLGMTVNRAPRSPKSVAWRWHLRNWVQYRWRELPYYLFLFVLPLLRWLIPALCVIQARLQLSIKHRDGTVTDLGTVGRHLVVTAGKNYLASCMDNTNEPEALKYHGYGTGTTAAAAGDTTLQTELTTQYATDNTRPTGSQSHSTNTYTTAATLSPDTGGTIAVTEWGLFTQAANSGGTMLDHQVFSAVNLVAGSDSLTTTYTLTFS